MEWNRAASWYLRHGDWSVVQTIAITTGLLFGRLAAGWASKLLREVADRPFAGWGVQKLNLLEQFPIMGPVLFILKGKESLGWGIKRLFIELFTTALFTFLIWGVARGRWQQIPEGGHVDWDHWRIAYHCCLMTFLITAAATDFGDCIIPDQITVPGMVIGVLGATLFANFQLVPLWVDWFHVLEGLQGPFIPGWLDRYRHLHGFCWSAAGLLTGFVLMGTIRWISTKILGTEAMGFGDVTLAAMIGAFIGWQPVMFVIALAPISGILVVISRFVMTGKSYVPFGPFLCSSAMIVVICWRWIWSPVHDVFGHPPTLLMLVGGCLVALAFLLLMLRLYHHIPVKRLSVSDVRNDIETEGENMGPGETQLGIGDNSSAGSNPNPPLQGPV